MIRSASPTLGQFTAVINSYHHFPPACSILSLQRELLVESESSHQSGGHSSLLLSQERLIRKAAGLSHFLINEVAVAPVSPTLSHHFNVLCKLIILGQVVKKFRRKYYT